jgi:hypothetical protein
VEEPSACTRYLPGPGLLIGHGSLWVLLTEPDDPQAVEEIWQLVRRGGSEAAARVLEVTRAAYAGAVPGLALVDLDRPSAPLTRGGGRVRLDGAALVLTLDPGTTAPATGAGRPLASGVVSAISAVVTPTPHTDAAPHGAQALIDGIPAAILAAKGPDGPPPPRPRQTPDPAPFPAAPLLPAPGAGSPGSATPEAGVPGAEVPERVDTGSLADTGALTEHGSAGADHDGATVQRTHLSSQDLPTVVAVACPQGHLTTPAEPGCRICGQRIAPQQPRTVVRPALGGLRLPTGEVVPLDRGVVVGRRPGPVPGTTDWPHLVHLPSTHAFVSRMHLQIELHGWDVLARDLGSRGGSVLTAPGRAPTPMRPGEAYVLDPGTVIDLAEVYAVRYETGVIVQ